jgi:hypothetical protein
MTHIDARKNITTTIRQEPPARGRIAVTALVAAGAMVAGTPGAASPANANADYYVAIAYSWMSDVSGVANNLADGEQARFAALKNCQDSGGNHCTWYESFRNECAALSLGTGAVHRDGPEQPNKRPCSRTPAVESRCRVAQPTPNPLPAQGAFHLAPPAPAQQ